MQPVKRPIAGIAQRIIRLGPFSSGDVVLADAQTLVEQFGVERPQALFLQTFAIDQRGKPRLGFLHPIKRRQPAPRSRWPYAGTGSSRRAKPDAACGHAPPPPPSARKSKRLHSST